MPGRYRGYAESPTAEDVKCTRCSYDHKVVSADEFVKALGVIPVWTCRRCGKRNGQDEYRADMLKRAKKNGLDNAHFIDYAVSYILAGLSYSYKRQDS